MVMLESTMSTFSVLSASSSSENWSFSMRSFTPIEKAR